MPCLPDEVIEKLKTEISLLRLIESHGYRPVRQGKDYAICCSFHENDDTPSLIISPKSNLFHCFGRKILPIACTGKKVTLNC